MWFYVESAKMHHKQIPYTQLHQHQPWEQLHGAPQPGHGSIPQPSFAAQRWPLSTPILGRLQDNAEAASYLITKGSLTPSCSLSFLPSVPDHSSITNYHCWAITVRISASTLRILQNCGSETCLPRRGKLKVTFFHQQSAEQWKSGKKKSMRSVCWWIICPVCKCYTSPGAGQSHLGAGSGLDVKWLFFLQGGIRPLYLGCCQAP